MKQRGLRRRPDDAWAPGCCSSLRETTLTVPPPAAYTQPVRMLTVSAREEAVRKEEGGMTLENKNNS